MSYWVMANPTIHACTCMGVQVEATIGLGIKEIEEQNNSL